MVRKWYTTFAVIGYIRGKKWWKWGARIVLFAACPALPTLRQGLLLWDSSIRPTFFDQKRQRKKSRCCEAALSEVAGTFSVPFGSPKGTHKGRKPLKRVKRRKAARNETHPAKLKQQIGKNSQNSIDTPHRSWYI